VTGDRCSCSIWMSPTTPMPAEVKKSNEIAPRDVAVRRGWTLKYVYDLLAAGRIRGAKKVGKRWSIPEDALKQTR